MVFGIWLPVAVLVTAVSGAVGNASAAVATGMADCVIAFRSLAQGQYARYGRSGAAAAVMGDDAFLFPYGVMSPAQRFAMKITRFMHDHGIRHEALRAIAMACYHHAQTNPNAVMNGRPLSAEQYDASRWIVEPILRKLDCCLESDGGVALLITTAERAAELVTAPELDHVATRAEVSAAELGNTVADEARAEGRLHALRVRVGTDHD